METIRRAVIDVGTNSVKLLIGDVRGEDVNPVHEESRQTRLGKGFYENRKLQPEAVAHTAEAVWEFAETARERNAASIRVIATSAARDAINPTDLTASIERACGLRTEIITGAREADWAFRGVTTDPEPVSRPLLLLDVGGGSSEFILGHGREKSFAHSFPLGTVRLMEAFPHSDPPKPKEFAALQEWLQQFLRAEIRPQLEPFLKKEPGEIQLVGTGGTASILARLDKKLDTFDRDQIERAVLRFESIKAHCRQLWSLPLAERVKTPGLPERRADVILTGVLIYEMVMAEFGFQQLRVSTRGLRFAALLDGSPAESAHGCQTLIDRAISPRHFMRALIVGCGYVGLPLGAELVRRGHEVFGLRRSALAAAELKHAGIIPVRADITRPDELAALPRNFDWIVNCTASGGGDADAYRRIYLEGTRNLLAWLAGASIKKFVYTSSTSVYAQNDGSVVTETSATEPEAGTAQILVATEQLLRQAARDGFPAVILRVAGIYGPARGHSFKAYLRGEARIEGEGTRILNMIHREDVIGIIIAALEGAAPGEIFNAVDNEPVTQLKFFEWLAAALDRPLPPRIPADAEAWRKRGTTDKQVSNAKLHSQLGYAFRHPDFRSGYTAEIRRMAAENLGA